MEAPVKAVCYFARYIVISSSSTGIMDPSAINWLEESNNENKEFIRDSRSDDTEGFGLKTQSDN